jgi:hypothetical protein
MLKESTKPLRRYFAILAVLYFLMGAGALAQVALLLIKTPGAHPSPLFLVQGCFTLLISFAYLFIAVKYTVLLLSGVATIKTIVHISFWGRISFGIIYMVYGSYPNMVGLAVSAVIYVYLLRSVDKLSREQTSADAAGQSMDPTLAPGTATAGQPPQRP